MTRRLGCRVHLTLLALRFRKAHACKDLTAVKLACRPDKTTGTGPDRRLISARSARGDHLGTWGNFRFPEELNQGENRFGFTGYIFEPWVGASPWTGA